MSSDKSQLDVSVIKNYLRERLRERNNDASLISGGLATDPAYDVEQSAVNVSQAIKNMMSYQDLRFAEKKPLDKGNRYLIRIRRLLHEEIRYFTLSPLIEQQSYFNSSTTAAIQAISRELVKLSESNEIEVSELRNLRESVEELRNLRESVEELRKLIRLIIGEDLINYKNLQFAAKFRGNTDDISQRQERYLKLIKIAYGNSGGKFLLDIGCGRGEFLELLRNDNIPARGVEISDEMVSYCKNKGLGVYNCDALNFLERIDDNSLLGVTAFQVVEHLFPSYISRLINKCYEKIRNAGVLVIETVNPLTLYSLSNFTLDMTHVKPIHPDTLKFYIQAAGFRDIELLWLSPVPEHERLQGQDENTKKLNDRLFGHQEYCLIAWK